ncbi:GNAT family N-acetyltransferase [Streptomyces africanus]|uniref:GNAT family N-acetyltransferase n=1 Tax=Streptomyces africanus TaxID=231024 RepID=UPI001FC90317|nr:GNAT family N-acetyltransferase [Streptomyces africanus]
MAREAAPRVQVDTLLSEHSPAKMLIELSESAHMVVLGSRRGGAVSHLGSTILAVAAHGSGTIVAVREDGDEITGGPVVVGVDGSPVSDTAVAAAFAEAWQRHTGATVALGQRQRLYRLGTLTVPRPIPPGRPRIAGEADRELLIRWHDEFVAAVGSGVFQDAAEWADARIEQGGVTFWETPGGTPAAMAGTTPEVAGQVRVSAVYTPSHLRGRGYAGAATAEVSRAALAAGVQEVLLFTDLANPTSNGLYQRIGYRPVADFAVYDFAGPSASA